MSNTPPFDQLTQPQRTALVSMLSGDSLGRTAALASVTGRTVRRWRRQPTFQAALAEARLDFFSACRSHLNASLAAAFQTLVATAGSSGNKSEQFKAATFLLDRVARTQMSAKPPQEIPKPSQNNNLDRNPGGPNRTLADISGSPRISPAAERTVPDAGGPERTAC